MSNLLTVVFDARDNLVDMLRARPALANVQVVHSHPGKDRVKARAIWIGSTTNGEQRAAVIGANKRREEFVIDLVVSVEYPGNDIEATEAELKPLVKEVAAAIREDHTLADAVDYAEVVPLSFDHFPGDDKRVAEFELGIACKAFRV